ncbi:hypothetical protein ACJX0J_021814, partial [Zea mays]
LLTLGFGKPKSSIPVDLQVDAMLFCHFKELYSYFAKWILAGVRRQQRTHTSTLPA